MSKRYVDVAKQLVRLYRLNLDCEDVIKEFLVTAEPEEVVKKELYDRLLENSIILADALSKYQSADMVEVVRCKYCKHRVIESNDDWCECTGCDINPDGFCDEGKRKETEDAH